jgi:hypothetical protein
VIVVDQVVDPAVNPDIVQLSDSDLDQSSNSLSGIPHIIMEPDITDQRTSPATQHQESDNADQHLASK